MVCRRVPRNLWDYRIKWVSEKMSTTHTIAGGIDRCSSITKVKGETADIFEYLDFGLYNKVWLRDNA